MQHPDLILNIEVTEEDLRCDLAARQTPIGVAVNRALEPLGLRISKARLCPSGFVRRLSDKAGCEELEWCPIHLPDDVQQWQLKYCSQKKGEKGGPGENMFIEAPLFGDYSAASPISFALELRKIRPFTKEEQKENLIEMLRGGWYPAGHTQEVLEALKA